MEDVCAIAQGASAALAGEALAAMARSWEGVQTLLARGEIAYGITTGFGATMDNRFRPVGAGSAYSMTGG